MSQREISLDSWNNLGEEVRPNTATKVRDAVLEQVPSDAEGEARDRLLDIAYQAGQRAIKESVPELAAQYAKYDIGFHILTSVEIETVEAPVLSGH